MISSAFLDLLFAGGRSSGDRQPTRSGVQAAAVTWLRVATV
jgi:hypothetical protein